MNLRDPLYEATVVGAFYQCHEGCCLAPVERTKEFESYMSIVIGAFYQCQEGCCKAPVEGDTGSESDLNSFVQTKRPLEAVASGSTQGSGRAPVPQRDLEELQADFKQLVDQGLGRSTRRTLAAASRRQAYSDF